MAATPEDTQRQIERLRSDATDTLEELRRRVSGGVQGVAATDARVAGARAREQLAERASENPSLVAVAGTVVAAALGYAVFSIVRGRREAQKPRNRLKRRVQETREEVRERLEETREQVERARRRGLQVRLGGDEDGLVVTDAKGRPLAQPEDEKGSRSDVLKKLVWAGVMSIFMAAASVLARRVAGDVWRATLREDPPTER